MSFSAAKTKILHMLIREHQKRIWSLHVYITTICSKKESGSKDTCNMFATYLYFYELNKSKKLPFYNEIQRVHVEADTGFFEVNKNADCLDNTPPHVTEHDVDEAVDTIKLIEAPDSDGISSTPLNLILFFKCNLVRMTWTLIDMLNFATLGLGKGIPPRDQLLILFFSRFLFCRTEAFKSYFFNHIVSLWNQLHPNTRSSVSFCILKTNAVLFLKSKFDSNFEANSICTWFLHVAAVCADVLRGRVRAAYFWSRGGMVLEVIRTCSSHALHWYLFVF